MELLEDKFQLIKTGSNTRIYRYGDKSSGVVLKVVPVQHQKQVKHMINQYKLLKKLNHQNIISVFKYKQSIKLNGMGQNSQLGLFNVLVIQQASRGNLLEFYKRNSNILLLPYIKYIFVSICNAVQFLHCNYIAHRDLKLQNILVFQSQGRIVIKLADFGFSSMVFDGQSIKTFNSFKGTKRGYMAPQIHDCLTDSSKTYEARKSDCFALGVILFSLVLGKLPFQYGNKQNKLYNLISEKNFDQFWRCHSKQVQILNLKQYSLVTEFKNLFQKMVAYDENERYTLQSILEDPWLKNGIASSLQSIIFK